MPTLCHIEGAVLFSRRFLRKTAAYIHIPRATIRCRLALVAKLHFRYRYMYNTRSSRETPFYAGLAVFLRTPRMIGCNLDGELQLLA